jgi:hypothetical protein
MAFVMVCNCELHWRFPKVYIRLPMFIPAPVCWPLLLACGGLRRGSDLHVGRDLTQLLHEPRELHELRALVDHRNLENTVHYATPCCLYEANCR